MMRVLVIALLATLAFTAMKCPLYKCVDDLNPKKLLQPTMVRCATRNQTTESTFVYSLQECPTGVCDIKFGNEPDFCKAQEEIPHLFPGEKCQKNDECYSAKCDSGACVGKKAGEACSLNDECGLGLACVSSKCETWKTKVNDACGMGPSDPKCASWMACANGKCQEAGSVKDGVECDAPLACESFFTYLKEGSTDTEVCMPGPTLVRKTTFEDVAPEKCASPTDKCSYSLKAGNATTTIQDKTCECGRTKDGSSYCPPGRGDLTEQVTKYVSWMKKKPSCHLSVRGFCNNVKDLDGYNEAFVAHSQLTQYPFFVDNDPCVQKIVNGPYWAAYNTLHPTQSSEETTTGASAITYNFAMAAVLALLAF